MKRSISPDSSFALEELLERSPNCLQENREIKSRTTVQLESLGGLLKDGYLMGRFFRTHEVETTITNNSACAFSCAVPESSYLNIRKLRNFSRHIPAFIPAIKSVFGIVSEVMVGIK